MKMRTYALLFFAFSLAASSLTWGASPVVRRGLPKGVYSPFPAPPSVRLSNGLNLDSSGNLMINAGLGGGGTSLSNGLSVDSSGNLLVNCATGCGGAAFTAAGDLSGSSTTQQVIGIKNNVIPSLTIGYLNWSGSAWVFSSPPGSIWNTVGAPGGAASFSMAGFSSTFNYTSALANAFSWINTTAATNGANQNSPQLNIASNYWSGASSQNSWTMQQVCGTGTNPACNFVFANSGSSGGGSLVMPSGATNGAGGGYYVYGQGADPNLTTLGILNAAGWGAPATVTTSYLALLSGPVPATGSNFLNVSGTANARGNYPGTWYTFYMPRASACPSNLDTILSTDDYGYVTWSDASPCAVTLPQASTLPANFFFNGCNINAGAVTITPTTSTISYTNGGNYLAGQASVSLSKGQCAQIYSDNTNFFANVNTANATTFNGAAGPTSANGVSSNGSGQLIASTAHNTAVPLLCADSSASGTTQTCTTSPSFVPATNDCVIYTTTTTNTGALTLNVNTLGADPVQKFFGQALVAGDILANKPQIACFDGANWQLMSAGANAPPSGCNIVQTNAGRNFSCQGSIALASGKFSTFNAETTAGVSTVYERGVTSQKAETAAADASVLAVTPASAIGTYRACVAISVSSATSGVIGWTLSWTDSSANAQSNIAQSLFQQGTAAPANTFTTSAAGNYNSCAEFDVNAAGAAITVKWVGGGTTAAKMSAVIERLQ